MAISLLHLNNSLVWFHYQQYFRRCLAYKGHNTSPETNIFASAKPRFSLNKKCTAKLNKNRKFDEAMLIVSNVMFAITDITVAFEVTQSVVVLSVLAKSKCF